MTYCKKSGSGHEANGQQTATKVEQCGVPAMTITTDVSDAVQVNKMVAEVVAKLGRVDMLMNNADISGGYAVILRDTR